MSLQTDDKLVVVGADDLNGLTEISLVEAGDKTDDLCGVSGSRKDGLKGTGRDVCEELFAVQVDLIVAV